MITQTLARLNAFSSKLKKSKTSQADRAADSEQSGSAQGGETYHGQVLERDSDDDAGNDKDWFKGKLKFKRHVDVRV